MYLKLKKKPIWHLFNLSLKKYLVPVKIKKKKEILRLKTQFTTVNSV